MVKRSFIFIVLLTILISISFISAITVNFNLPTETNGAFLSKTYILVNVSVLNNVTALSNITINLYNSSGVLNSSYNNSGENFLYKNISGLTQGLWFFNATAYNTTDTLNSTSTYNITIDTTAPSSVTIVYPLNITYGINVSAINYTVTDNVAASRCWYSNDSGVNNYSIQNSGTNFTNVITKEGSNSFTVYCNDSAGNINYSIIGFSIDRIYPQISLVSPDNDSNWRTSSNVTFIYNVTDTGISNCSLIVDNSIVQTNTSISVNTTQTFISTLSNADHSWRINCTDYAGNVNFSETRILHVNYTSSGDSGDVGGYDSSANFWINTQPVSNKQFTDGYTQLLPKKYRMQFTIDTKFHYIGVVDLTTTTATINLSSTSIQTVFNIGDVKKFDLTNDSYYDIYIKLNSITNLKANITIKKINESIQVTATPPGNLSGNLSGILTNETQPDNTREKPNPSIIMIISIIVIVIIVIIIIVIYFVINHKKNNVKHQTRIKVFDF